MKNRAILMISVLALATSGGAPFLFAQAAPGSAPLTGPQDGPPFRPTHPIVILGGMMIDGTSSRLRQDQALVIEGERISWLGPMEEVQIPSGAEVIDASGMTVMPGLINGNGYVTLRGIYPAPAADLTLQQLQDRWDETWSAWQKRAFVWLMRGVTGIRNSSGPLARVRSMKQAIDRGEVAGPRIYMGGTLIFSEPHFRFWTRNTPDPKAVEWLRKEFAFTVVKDVDRDTDALVSDDIRYWKFYLTDEPWDGKNEFTDDELRFMYEKAHRNGIRVDLHSGVHMRRAVALGADTVQHPFVRNELVEWDVIQSFVKNGTFASTCLTQNVVVPQFAADPHHFNEVLYSTSLSPEEYRILMRYRDRMLWNLKNADSPGLLIGDPQPFAAKGALSFNEQQKQRQTARENMRRFIKAGVKFFMATDSEAFLNFQQENPDANEIRYMVELGMTPMDAILAATRNGAEALGILDQVGTLEKGKLADVIIVPGNPLLDLKVMERIFVTIKGGVRYK
jgi:imidazolonepropionase-like amidohydrolase